MQQDVRDDEIEGLVFEIHRFCVLLGEVDFFTEVFGACMCVAQHGSGNVHRER